MCYLTRICYKLQHKYHNTYLVTILSLYDMR
jgi:hypothetical protein